MDEPEKASIPYNDTILTLLQQKKYRKVVHFINEQELKHETNLIIRINTIPKPPSEEATLAGFYIRIEMDDPDSVWKIVSDLQMAHAKTEALAIIRERGEEKFVEIK